MKATLRRGAKKLERVKLARQIAARTEPCFVDIPRNRGRHINYTDEQLAATREGLTVKKYRRKSPRKRGKK
jgi:hypothetical protein